MNVQTTEARELEDIRRQNLTVGCDGDQFGLKSAHFFNEAFVARAFGLQDWQICGQGKFFHWRTV
jgi:hypothetical protein